MHKVGYLPVDQFFRRATTIPTTIGHSQKLNKGQNPGTKPGDKTETTPELLHPESG